MVHITGSYTQILPTETVMKDILALPDQQQRLSMELPVLRSSSIVIIG